MAERVERGVIPLFPLGMVLVPGLVLPLHVFEERYRTLVRDLLARPDDEPASFGVIGIRQGRETGADNLLALYDVGTTATLQRVEEQPDGRFHLVTVGAERFRIRELRHDRAYLQADVEVLAEDTGDGDPAELAAEVQAAFRSYLDVLGETQGAEIGLSDVPTEPASLAWLVSATVLVDLPVRQSLLEEPTLTSRLRAERALLRNETAMLRTVAAAPAPDLTRTPQSPN